MHKVLVTGGAGFIGSHLSRKMKEKGYAVTVLDNLSVQVHGSPESSYTYNLVKDQVEFILGDIRNRDDWRKALNGTEVVVHLAAETGTGQSMYEIQKYFDVNVMGTSILLDILANEKHTVRKMILSSSRSVYGEGRYSCLSHGSVYPAGRDIERMKQKDFECHCPECDAVMIAEATTEGSTISPVSVYAITKYTQELMMQTAGKALGIPVVVFRFQNVYGPGQSLKNPYTGILSIFSNLLRNDDPVNVFEDGKESRDFVFIEDVVNAVIKGVEKNEGDGEVFNMGSGKAISVYDVAGKLKTLLDSQSNIEISGDFRAGDIRHNFADITKLRKILGYNPSFSFEKGIQEFISWTRHQVPDKISYKESIQEMQSKKLFFSPNGKGNNNIII
jgi:dTDP-L-rhamnose 4-epimerase